MKNLTVHFRLALLLAAAALIAPAPGTRAAEEAKKDAAKAPAAKEAKADDYPLDTCPVTGGKLGEMGKPVVHNYKGREVRFCCGGCVKPFEKEPAKYLKKMDEAIIKKETATYPLKTCVVTGDKLGGEMGKPIDLVVQNHLVRVCCAGCVKKVEKEPAKYLKMIAAARKEAEAKKKAGAAKEPAAKDAAGK